LQKLLFLQDFGEFKKGTYLTILGEEQYYYHIQKQLNSLETFGMRKNGNGKIFQVVERS